MREPPTSLGAELRAAAREAPARCFLRMPGVELSYADADRLSDALARGLAAQGVRAGDRVSLMLPNGAEFVLLWFALAKLGAVTAPVNTAFRGEVLRQAIDLVNSRLLIAHESLREQWAGVWPALAKVERLVLVGAPPGPDDPDGTLGYEALLADTAGPLKNAIARRAMGLEGDLPKLARAAS